MTGDQTQKLDVGKPMMGLIPPEACVELARLYTAGAIKYTPRGWEEGIEYSRIDHAMMRHREKYRLGEVDDPETNCHHMIALAFGAFAIATYDARGMLQFDDMPYCDIRDRMAFQQRIERFLTA